MVNFDPKVYLLSVLPVSVASVSVDSVEPVSSVPVGSSVSSSGGIGRVTFVVVAVESRNIKN